jgi:hypothetical protein
MNGIVRAVDGGTPNDVEGRQEMSLAVADSWRMGWIKLDDEGRGIRAVTMLENMTPRLFRMMFRCAG